MIPNLRKNYLFTKMVSSSKSLDPKNHLREFQRINLENLLLKRRLWLILQFASHGVNLWKVKVVYVVRFQGIQKRRYRLVVRTTRVILQLFLQNSICSYQIFISRVQYINQHARTLNMFEEIILKSFIFMRTFNQFRDICQHHFKIIHKTDFADRWRESCKRIRI